MIRFRHYSAESEAEWNAFVAASRNGTFLHDRRYMDYHSDRFTDGSLLVEHDEQVVALLPANRTEDALVSHGGLTYGGFLVNERMTAPLMLAVFQDVAPHLRGLGYGRLIYKAIPHIYHRSPAEEDLYALFRLGARLTRRDVLSVVDQTQRLPLQDRRRRGARKAADRGHVVAESDDWRGFWRLLAGRLDEKYQTRPVHSAEEMELLGARFPKSIRLFVCRQADEIMAGVAIYDTGQVVHAQYIAASEEGRKGGAQDLLFLHLIDLFSDRRWFDFGVSNEDQGRYLNEGLVQYKEGFGARTVAHDFYELSL